MMNYGNYAEGWNGPQEMQPIVCPPNYRFHDEFMPREVPVIHPIVNVNRQHFVDVPRHYFTETTENVMGTPVHPHMGRGCGCQGRCQGRCGNAGRSPWM